MLCGSCRGQNPPERRRGQGARTAGVGAGTGREPGGGRSTGGAQAPGSPSSVPTSTTCPAGRPTAGWQPPPRAPRRLQPLPVAPLAAKRRGGLCQMHPQRSPDITPPMAPSQRVHSLAPTATGSSRRLNLLLPISASTPISKHFNCLPIDPLNSPLTHIMFDSWILGKRQLGAARIHPERGCARVAERRGEGAEKAGSAWAGGWLEQRGGRWGSPQGSPPSQAPRPHSKVHGHQKLLLKHPQSWEGKGTA